MMRTGRVRPQQRQRAICRQSASRRWETQDRSEELIAVLCIMHEAVDFCTLWSFINENTANGTRGCVSFSSRDNSFPPKVPRRVQRDTSMANVSCIYSSLTQENVCWCQWAGVGSLLVFSYLILIAGRTLRKHQSSAKSLSGSAGSCVRD